MKRVAHLIAILFVLFSLLACVNDPETNSQRVSREGREMAAEVLGEQITVAEVDAQIKDNLFEERVRGDAAELFKLRSETTYDSLYLIIR